jgi:cystathionine beta-lyase/cystathionine gamma-synthase
MERKPGIRRRKSPVVPNSTPIFQTAAYDFPDLDSLDDYYEGRGSYLYGREGLPNSDELAGKVAELEHAEKGVACSSGMAALFLALTSSAGAGDHVVASPDLYGGTLGLLRKELPRFGILTSFRDPSDVSAFDGEMRRRKAKFALVETISNPTMKLCDIKRLAEAAAEAGTVLIVDNTFASPFVVRPLDLGADIVMHSGTKSLGGHHDLTIGLLCGSKGFIDRVIQYNIILGAMASPFDSWLATRSLFTWRLRMEKSCRNAMKLARHLETRKEVEDVFYPGLESHPQHDLARRLFKKNMYGGMLSFTLKGGLPKADSFVKALRRVTLTPSLGGVLTSVVHPAKTSHRRMEEAERRSLGVTDSMIRVSVGTEEFSLIEDEFDRALRVA